MSFPLAAGLLLLAAIPALANVRVETGHLSEDATATSFRFERVPLPAKNDAATRAKFTIIAGSRDSNGGDLAVLHDGQLPAGDDRPTENFFFAAGTDGGRLLIDLGEVTEIRQVNSYSWHRDTRAPQVYRLYASDGTVAGFKMSPGPEIDPTNAGWRFLASIDTRPPGATDPSRGGGRHGVCVSDSEGSIGKYRYVLFDIVPTEKRDGFGNTFFSEIDVIDSQTPPVAIDVSEEVRKPILSRFGADGGRYHFAIDTTLAPDLTEWSDKELRPVVQEWYPKLVTLLPSEGFEPRTNVTIRFRNDLGRTPASAGGGFINCNARWFRGELQREARGSVVHEMVHVVQSYARGRRDAEATRMPGWLVEGIPDYIRWFIYEPQTDGARITTNNLSRASYDASYRITGNFLDWVVRRYDSNIVQKINAAGRAGRYREELWKEHTGHTLQDLGAEWLRFHEERLGKTKPATPASNPAAPGSPSVSKTPKE